MTDAELEAFARLLSVCRRLRGPDGCPWDREQTLETMTPYLTEEAAESVDAIGSGSQDDTIEELGDLLFLALFCLELSEERWGVGIAAALDRASDKLVRRHPHVYGDKRLQDGESAFQQWQEIKKAEKAGRAEPASLIGEIPKALPALVASFRVQEKAAAVGFDWPDSEGPLAKVREEVEEIDQALHRASPDARHTASEIGDLLFATVNLSRHLKIDPERELRMATKRFRDRFLHVEQRLGEQGRTPRDATLEEMDQLWDEAKRLAHGQEEDPR